MKANETQVGGNHYLSPIQHWDYVIANDIPYLEAQVIKYLTRWRKKGGLQDVYKARHFLEKLIEVEEAKQKDQRDHMIDMVRYEQDGHGFGHAVLPEPKVVDKLFDASKTGYTGEDD